MLFPNISIDLISRYVKLVSLAAHIFQYKSYTKNELTFSTPKSLVFNCRLIWASPAEYCHYWLEKMSHHLGKPWT